MYISYNYCNFILLCLNDEVKKEEYLYTNNILWKRKDNNIGVQKFPLFTGCSKLSLSYANRARDVEEG